MGSPKLQKALRSLCQVENHCPLAFAMTTLQLWHLEGQCVGEGSMVGMQHGGWVIGFPIGKVPQKEQTFLWAPVRFSYSWCPDTPVSRQKQLAFPTISCYSNLISTHRLWNLGQMGSVIVALDWDQTASRYELGTKSLRQPFSGGCLSCCLSDFSPWSPNLPSSSLTTFLETSSYYPKEVSSSFIGY